MIDGHTFTRAVHCRDVVRFVTNLDTVTDFQFTLHEGVVELQLISVLLDPAQFGQALMTVVIFVAVHVQITLAGGDVGFAVGTDGVGAIGGLPLGGTDAHVVGTTRTCGAGRRGEGGVAVWDDGGGKGRWRWQQTSRRINKF